MTRAFPFAAIACLLNSVARARSHRPCVSAAFHSDALNLLLRMGHIIPNVMKVSHSVSCHRTQPPSAPWPRLRPSLVCALASSAPCQCSLLCRASALLSTLYSTPSRHLRCPLFSTLSPCLHLFPVRAFHAPPIGTALLFRVVRTFRSVFARASSCRPSLNKRLSGFSRKFSTLR